VTIGAGVGVAGAWGSDAGVGSLLMGRSAAIVGLVSKWASSGVSGRRAVGGGCGVRGWGCGSGRRAGG
jgi:hypothetical protein